MRLTQQYIFLSIVLVLLLLISNVSCDSINPFPGTVHKQQNWSWSKKLQAILQKSGRQKKPKYANYGIFINRKQSQEEAEAFRDVLQAGLDGNTGRYSFESTYPFEEQSKLDMVFAKLETSLVESLKTLRIVKDVILSETPAQPLPVYYEEPERPPGWTQIKQATQEVQMLNQAPGQAESDAKPDPHPSKGKGITIFMIDTGAHSSHERVTDWLWPGEQPHDKSFVGKSTNPQGAFHGSTVLDVLLDPRNGAGQAKVVVVRPPSGGMETLLDTINQIGLYIKENGLQGVTALNWSFGWYMIDPSGAAWIEPIRERYQWLTRGYGAHSIIAAGNDERFPYEFSGFPEYFHKEFPLITVGNVLYDGKTIFYSQAPNLVTTNAMGSWVETPEGEYVSGTSFSAPQITARIVEWLSPEGHWRPFLLKILEECRKVEKLQNSKYGVWDGWAKSVEWLVRMKSYPRTQTDPDNFTPIFWSGYDSRFPDFIPYSFYPGGKDAESWKHLQASPERIKEVIEAEQKERMKIVAQIRAKQAKGVKGNTRSQTDKNSNIDDTAAGQNVQDSGLEAGDTGDQISGSRTPIEEIVSTENSATDNTGATIGSKQSDSGRPINHIPNVPSRLRRPPRSLSRQG